MIFKGNEYKKRETHTTIRNDHGRRFMSNFDGILTNTNRYHVQISLAMYADAIVDFIRLVDVQSTQSVISNQIPVCYERSNATLRYK